MPRRAAAQIRPVEPDPVHRSRLVQQVVNKVMLDGKKSTAERIVYDALAILAEKTRQGPGRGARGVDQDRSRRRSRSARAASAAPPIRFRSRFRPPGLGRSPSAGWSSSPVTAARRLMAPALGQRADGCGVPAGWGVQAQGRHLFRMAQANKAFAHYRW